MKIQLVLTATLVTLTSMRGKTQTLISQEDSRTRPVPYL